MFVGFFGYFAVRRFTFSAKAGFLVRDFIDCWGEGEVTYKGKSWIKVAGFFCWGKICSFPAVVHAFSLLPWGKITIVVLREVVLFAVLRCGKKFPPGKVGDFFCPGSRACCVCCAELVFSA